MPTVGLAWLEMGREARRAEVGEEQELAEFRLRHGGERYRQTRKQDLELLKAAEEGTDNE